MTSGLLISSFHKHKLLNTKLKTPTPHNVRNYATYDAVFKKVCRLAKKKHYEQMLNNNINDSKTTWKILRDVAKLSTKTKCMPSAFDVNGRIVSDPEEIANNFNEYFSNIGADLGKQATPQQTSFKRHLVDNCPNSFFMCPVPPDELITTAQSLKSKLSQGHDLISSKLTQLSIASVAMPLSHIFNLSFIYGVVPDFMKLAKVIPIFKSSNVRAFSNYRPISILPAFSKLLEKLVCKRLTSFIDNNNILNEKQFGFRKKHSTIDSFYKNCHLIK
jgi:hypothetical protein